MEQSIDVKRSWLKPNQYWGMMMSQYDLHGVYLTLIRGCSDAAVRHKCCFNTSKATQAMFSITCPWLSSHHVTLSRRLRDPSIDLGLNKLIMKFPGLSNRYDIKLSNGYLQLLHKSKHKTYKKWKQTHRGRPQVRDGGQRRCLGGFAEIWASRDLWTVP